ncbi:MAG: RecX family transcriptional regulator [Bryobacteraceae bacterium]|nr:RecX family transcriptional regulator [Bryobacteraceae bacterium]
MGLARARRPAPAGGRMLKGGKKEKKLNAPGLWEYALRALSARPHSSSELRDKLRRRAESPGDAAETLAKLEHYGYLDDRRMAESYAAARRDNQRHGKFRVLRDLQQRRVASGVARQAVERVYQDADESQLIAEFLRRKYRGVALAEHLAEPKNLASAYRKLLYAGFSSAAASKALRHYSESADELEPPEEGL